MNRLSVVIPSRNAANFVPCAEAVRRHEPAARIILIDDGMDLSWLPRPDLEPCIGFTTHWEFNFSRNCNKGIELAGDDDVVLLNDDALLETRGGLSLLQECCALNPDFGIIGATTNSVGNRNQLRRDLGFREDTRMVCFIAVLIPRRTIDAVGVLDEDYDCYSHQDDDYCHRVRQAGLRIGVHDGCYVDHKRLHSTFRGPGGPGGDLNRGARIFMRKHGFDPR